MDELVVRGIQKWPNVPSVFGWLSLDERGRWRLDGGLVRNRRTIAAINRNYLCDGGGRWYYQNGPQRAYVDLNYTPWIYLLDGKGGLTTHTGLVTRKVKSCWLDDEYHLLLQTEHGIGQVGDHDLGVVLDNVANSDGEPADWIDIEKAVHSYTSELYLHWGVALPIGIIARATVASRFGFIERPRD